MNLIEALQAMKDGKTVKDKQVNRFYKMYKDGQLVSCTDNVGSWYTEVGPTLSGLYLNDDRYDLVKIKTCFSAIKVGQTFYYKDNKYTKVAVIGCYQIPCVEYYGKCEDSVCCTAASFVKFCPSEQVEID